MKFGIATQYVIEDTRDVPFPLVDGMVFTIARAGIPEYAAFVRKARRMSPVFKSMQNAVVIAAATGEDRGEALRMELRSLDPGDLADAMEQQKPAIAEHLIRDIKPLPVLNEETGEMENKDYTPELGLELLRSADALVPSDICGELVGIHEDTAIGDVITHWVLQRAQETESFRASETKEEAERFVDGSAGR